MEWLFALPPALITVYVGWQFRNLSLWTKTPDEPAVDAAAYPSIAVVVPYRNEANHLPALLDSLYGQDYPGFFEIILVDDFSTDGGLNNGFPAGRPVRNLLLADFPEFLTPSAHKKSALRLGIHHTNCDVVVTTDADCQWPSIGLRRIGQVFANGAEVALGPVLVEPVNDLCTAFQALDLAAYQLFTRATVAAGTPALANGAHFAFTKQAFEAVGGYRGVDHLPSGDDVLLLHKFVAAGFGIGYVASPDAVVTTQPVTGWRNTWKQRLRWASKAGNYASLTLTIAQALAYLTSLTILSCLLLTFVRPLYGLLGLAIWGIKAAVDYLLLRSICKFYNRTELMRWYGPVQFLYPFYLVAVGTAALAGVTAEWKGRG